MGAIRPFVSFYKMKSTNRKLLLFPPKKIYTYSYHELVMDQVFKSRVLGFESGPDE